MSHGFLHGMRGPTGADSGSTPGGRLAGGGSSDQRLLRRTRWRLIAWSGGSTLVALLVLGAAIYWAVATSLASVGTAQLQERAGQLLAKAMTLPVAAKGADGTGGAAVLAPDPALPGVVFGGSSSGTLGYIVSVRVSAQASSSQASSAPLPGATRPPVTLPEGGGPVIVEKSVTGAIAQRALDAAGLQAAASGHASVHTATIAGTPVRILSEPVVSNGQTALIQVIGDRTTEVRTLQTLLLVLVTGGLLVLALSLGVGYVYAGRALVPIRESLRRQREFAADASHELRTPLTILRASVEHLQRHPDAPVATVGSALQDIDTESVRLGELVDQLLLLARSDSGGLEIEHRATDLSDAVVEAASGLRPLADRSAVTLELDLAPAPLQGDPDRLRQLVALLVDNAIRHSPDGGIVRVRARAAGSAVTLDVEDEGPGIAPGELPHLFERFYRGASAPPGGSGLGLAIAHWIVTRHGGSIEAENLSGQGARFRVRLRRA
jgi:signal transduction histidine kinase